MRYRGEFMNAQGRLCSVEIETTGSPLASMEIGNGEQGVFFDLKEPVKLATDTQDIFDPLILQRGTIKLLTRSFLPDLFRADCKESKVTISEEGHCIFRGFVLPRTYTQEFCNAEDSLDVNVIDRLTALQWYKWERSAVLSRAEARGHNLPVASVLDICFSKAGIQWEEVKCTGVPLMQENGKSALEGVMVNTEIFEGDDNDSGWNLLEVITETLRYLNLHVIDAGEEVIVFSWEQIKNNETEIGNIDTSNAYGADTRIEIGEIWNKFRVVCETDEREELIPDPFDKEKCTSPYKRAQHYKTGFYLNIPYPVEDDSLMFGRLLYGSTYPNVVSNETWRRDWWLRVLENPGWTFYKRKPGSVWIPNMQLPDDLEDRAIYSDNEKEGKREWLLAERVTAENGAALFEVFTGKQEHRPDNNAVATDLDSSKVMIINVGGDTMASSPTPTTWRDAATQQQWRMHQESMPRAVWRGGTMNLSPDDDETVRYLDISGKIALMPTEPLSVPWSVYERYRNSHPVEQLGGGAQTIRVDCNTSIRKKGKDKLMAAAEYFHRDQEPTTDHPGYPGIMFHSTEADSPGFNFFQEDEITQAAQVPPVDYTHLSGGVNVGTKDMVEKVGVLVCALIVGDKCLEEYSTNDRSAGNYRWVKKMDGSLTTFTLGFDVKPGDYLIGKEYPIVKNMSYSDLMDLKGTAIPIRKSDKLSGEVTFLILGPAPVSFYGNLPIHMNSFYPDYIPFNPGQNVMRQVDSIWVKDFNIRLVSDNAGLDPLDESDIVYTSDIDEGYENEHEEITMKICSALTVEERAELSVADKILPNTALDAETLSGITALWHQGKGMVKPEQAYVDWYYRECSKPRISLEQSVRCMVRNPLFTLWKHPALGNVFYVTGWSRDLKAGTTGLELRERK